MVLVSVFVCSQSLHFHSGDSKHDVLTVWDVEMYSFLYEQSSNQSLFDEQRQQELRRRRSRRATQKEKKRNKEEEEEVNHPAHAPPPITVTDSIATKSPFQQVIMYVCMYVCMNEYLYVCYTYGDIYILSTCLCMF